MADDYTLIFLGELAAGLLIFCGISGYAYHRIKQYKKDIGQLRDRLTTIQHSLHASRSDMAAIGHEAENRLSASEMDQAVSLFSMHVLHHLPKPRAGRATGRNVMHIIKQKR